uniref:response regulator transcription factor n=1 Tax=uncultured Boseongicola sp. TaxID=1648499 RepID=UPI002631A68D
MSSDKILIVDDESKMRMLLRRCLEGDGFDVIEAEDEAGTLNAIHSHNVQLVTLDLQLGRENGLEIAKRIRQHSDVPIIVVSGRDDVIDRVVGLELGADDYITKPFHVREVLARVRSVLRRTGTTKNPQLTVPEPSEIQPEAEEAVTFDGMTAYLDRFELLDRTGARVEMTSGDFQLLAIFLRNP